MNRLYVENFADLMHYHAYGEIINPLGDNTVRKLSVAGGRVQVDAMQPPIVSVSLDEPINYEPWVFDRGNLVFHCDEITGGKAKICTEFDFIRFPDGTEYEINPGKGEGKL